MTLDELATNLVRVLRLMPCACNRAWVDSKADSIVIKQCQRCLWISHYDDYRKVTPT